MQSETAHPQGLEDNGVSVSLTYGPLDVSSVVASVRSPRAGAIVLFAGELLYHFCMTLAKISFRYHARQL